MTIGDAIAHQCHARGIALSELARRIGISRQALHNRLGRETISYASLKIFADALGCNVSDFFLILEESGHDAP